VSAKHPELRIQAIKRWNGCPKFGWRSHFWMDIAGFLDAQIDPCRSSLFFSCLIAYNFAAYWYMKSKTSTFGLPACLGKSFSCVRIPTVKLMSVTWGHFYQSFFSFRIPFHIGPGQYRSPGTAWPLCGTARTTAKAVICDHAVMIEWLIVTLL
jgi:hypothetical protein